MLSNEIYNIISNFVGQHGYNISVSDKTGFDYRLFSLMKIYFQQFNINLFKERRFPLTIILCKQGKESISAKYNIDFIQLKIFHIHSLQHLVDITREN